MIIYHWLQSVFSGVLYLGHWSDQWKGLYTVEVSRAD